MGEWKQTTFGCFDNCGLCILSWFCPCIVVGQAAEKIGENCMLCAVLAICFTPIPEIVLRGRIRAQNGIEVRSIRNDMLFHTSSYNHACTRIHFTLFEFFLGRCLQRHSLRFLLYTLHCVSDGNCKICVVAARRARMYV